MGAALGAWRWSFWKCVLNASGLACAAVASGRCSAVVQELQAGRDSCLGCVGPLGLGAAGPTEMPLWVPACASTLWADCLLFRPGQPESMMHFLHHTIH